MEENFVYPFDPTGIDPENFVVSEPHTVEFETDTIIIPRHGPFYADALVVRDQLTNQPLVENVDYRLGNYYKEASQATGKPVYALIYLLNRDVDSTALIDYHVVGGQYSYDLQGLYELLLQLKERDTTVLWDDIIKPDSFPPSMHVHHADELYGFEPVIEALYAIEQQMRYRNTELPDEVAEDVINILMNGILKNLPIDNVDGLRDILNLFAAKQYDFEQRFLVIEAAIAALQAKDVELRSLIDANTDFANGIAADLAAAIIRIAQNETDISWIKTRLIELQSDVDDNAAAHALLVNRVDSLRVDVDGHTTDIATINSKHTTLLNQFNTFKAATNNTLGTHAGTLGTHTSQIADIYQTMAGYIFYKLSVDRNQSGGLLPDTVWLANSTSVRNRSLPTNGLRGGEIIIVKDETGGAASRRIEISGNINGSPDGIFIDKNYGAVNLVYSIQTRKWHVMGGL